LTALYFAKNSKGVTTMKKAKFLYKTKDEKGYDIYSDPRALTLYELMRIMTIPDTWPIPDDVNIHLLRRVIGEGVPSLLIRKIFQQII
jgi:DNA (cytosine-5)-methyltransferase 1